MGFVQGARGALFIDIDGTIVNHGTDTPVPFAVEKINRAYDKGYTIILTTLRGDGWADQTHLTCMSTLRLLKDIGLKYHHIIWNCQSPRIVINDEGAIAINHPANGSWENYEF
jgi:ribonucleotide monophosphatase NagD (HAD superfamily)